MRIALWCLIWSALPTSAWAQSPSDKTEEDSLIYAQRHFERGRDAFKNGDYATALSAFESSLSLFPSPNTRLYLARTLVKAERFTDAANTYEEVIRSARLKESEEPSYAAARSAAERELADLQHRLARVTIVFSEQAEAVTELTVNDKQVPRQAYGLPIYVRPGTVKLRATYQDGRAQEQTVKLSAEERKTITIKPSRNPVDVEQDKRDPQSQDAEPEGPAVDSEGVSSAAVGFGIGAGVAAVGWGGALLFGLLADNQYSDLRQECGGPCPPERTSDIDTGERYQTIANAGIIVGAIGTAAVAVALVFLLSEPDQSEDEEGISLGPGSVRLRW